MATEKTWKNIAPKLLCPPGDGVFTVNTAKERKQKLQKKLYPEAHTPAEIQTSWIKSLETVKPVQLFGLCSDCGGGILRGANWGPLFLRNTLNEHHPELNYTDLGDVRVIPHLLHDKYLNQETISNCRKALYNDPQSLHSVSPLSIAEEFLTQFYKDNSHARLFSLGGDHSVSYPFVKTYLEHKNRLGIKTAVIHFDAHTDLLTERLGIDLCFGSWCPAVLPLLANPSHLIQLGIRSSGKDRGHWEKTFGVKQYWAQELQSEKLQSILDEIIAFLKKEGIQEIYISFDIDAIDSEFASATGTPEEAGLRPDTAALMIKRLMKEFPLTGADLVEVAPFLKTNDKTLEPETTLRVAGSLIALMIEGMNGGC